MNFNKPINNHKKKSETTESTHEGVYDETTIPETPRGYRESIYARTDILSDLLSMHTMEAPTVPKEANSLHYKKDGLFIRQRTAPGPKLASPYMDRSRKASLFNNESGGLNFNSIESPIRKEKPLSQQQNLQSRKSHISEFQDSESNDDDGFSFECK